MNRPVWARSFAVVLLAAGLVVGPASATSCADAIEWKGVLYTGASIEEPLRFAARLGDGLVPACGASAAGCRAEEGDPIALFRLPGIEPVVAVGAHGPFGPTAYLAPGYLDALPDHPLHDEIYGSARRPNERVGWVCGAPITLTGTVVNPPSFGGLFSVRFKGEEVRRQDGWTAVSVDTRTRVIGFDRNGLPYLEEGDRIEAAARECTTGETQYKVVADRIASAE